MRPLRRRVLLYCGAMTLLLFLFYSYRNVDHPRPAKLYVRRANVKFKRHVSPIFNVVPRVELPPTRIVRRTETSIVVYDHTKNSSLFPDPELMYDDRILLQIDHMNSLAQDISLRPVSRQTMKIILLHRGFDKRMTGRQLFLDQNCPVNICKLSQDWTKPEQADAVVFQTLLFPPMYHRPRDQLWILHSLESPTNTRDFRDVENKINWTASYRTDSTIVTPYEKYVPNFLTPNPNLAFNRTGKVRRVAWFVSNCHTPNHRFQYALQLNKYYPVDIYGECGSYQCLKTEPEKCHGLMKKYKYYLSFENSNCREYITEKYFTNGLRNNIVPIVMGAPKSDYERVSPPNSFIHVDDFRTPRQLGQYLRYLDRNADEYESYFQWRREGGAFIDTMFWCRLCAMLNDLESLPVMYYTDVNKWWRGKGTCVRSSWMND